MKCHHLLLHTMLALTVAGSISFQCQEARSDTPRVPTYPTLAANPDLVQCGPYDTIASGTANWGTGLTGGSHTRECITLANQYRIRQTGVVQRIRVNLQEATGLTGFYFRLWRRIGDTYDMVGSSENLAPAMIAGLNTLDLKRPIAAQQGDYYGYRIESTAATNFFARTGPNFVGTNTFSVTDANAGSSDFNWAAQPRVLRTVLPVEIYMQAPILVAIGDSLMSGWPSSHTFLESGVAQGPRTDIVSYLGEQWRVTWQNMAVPGQGLQGITARFTTDVVNLRPRLALITGGAGNLVNGDSEELFLQYWKQMLEACKANGIKPLVMLITPARPSLYSNAQSERREVWNAALRALVSDYPGAVVVDASTYIGAYRPGGPPNNLWDLAQVYNSGDGVHPNAAGHQRIAQAIVDQYTEP